MNKVSIMAAILSHEFFIKEHWAQKPCVFRVGNDFLKPSKLPSALDLLTVNAVEQPELTAIIKRGRKNYLPEFALEDKVEVAYTLSQVRTVVVYNFEKYNKFYRTLAQRLSDIYSAPNLVAAFISHNKSKGLNKHKDDYHIFVLQHVGECRWRIHDRKGRKLLRETVLKPGDVLYVPAGFYHRVIRETKETVHVTMGLSYTGIGTEFKALFENPVFGCLLDPEQKKLGINKLKNILDERFHIRAIHRKRKRRKRKPASGTS